MKESRRERIVTAAVASVLALMPAWFIATQLDPLLIPTDKDVAKERQRQRMIAASRFTSSAALDPAGRPLLDGVAAAVPSSKLEIRDFPNSGTVDYEYGDYSHGVTSIELMDATDNGLDKAVRLRSAQTGSMVATIYIPGGGRSNAEVPAGTYRVTIAEGLLWYGRVAQFGAKGRYYAPQELELPAGTSAAITFPPARSDEPTIASIQRDKF